MKKIIILIFVFIIFNHKLFAFQFYEDVDQASGSNNSSMQVLTMNVHCFDDEWEFRLNQILKQVIVISPDVIAFQEVCENPITRENQLNFIKSFLIQNNYPLKAFESQYTHKAWDKYNEFIILISKKDISAIDKGFLPRSLLQRGYIGFYISNTWFINTHLEYRADNFQYRINQIDFLTTHFANQGHFIMGDFNSSPEDREQHLFKERGYTGFFPGVTLVGEEGLSHRNIDGFWFSPLFFDQISSHSGTILFKDKVQDRYLSDHFAVLINLILKK